MILSWTDCHAMTISIHSTCKAQQWVPDFIIGLSRGGNVPATILSHSFNVPCRIFSVSFRDFEECDDMTKWFDWIHIFNKKTLIVDDINDSGRTLQYIKDTYNTRSNVKFATLVHNHSSSFNVDYYGMAINKAEKDVWVTFPWENGV